MRLSRFHAPTLKEAPKEAELASHALLVRGGFIRMLAAGIYDFLPLGVRTLEKIKNILREELTRSGAMEVFLPAVQPAELWKESGRWFVYGAELLRFKDRHGREFCLGPTHEEVITDLVRRDVRSYRDLPLNLFQIQTKFRDEIKPRAGLMRGREFIMKDGYSFDATEEAAKAQYAEMYDAYRRIFTRCGLDFRAVEADTGNIGGSMSHEFQVVADTGEDYVLKCGGCDFTVNQELAPLPELPVQGPDSAVLPVERVHTPAQRTIEEVSAFLETPADRIVKTLIYKVDGNAVALLIRGDHELSEVKLRRAFKATSVEMADEATVTGATGAIVGFAGPVGLSIPVYADWAVAELHDVVTGANEDYFHFRHVEPGRDFTVAGWHDLRNALDADRCPRCEGGTYKLFRGIEVGHVFYLGTKYSKAMDCGFLDEEGNQKPAIMGCYGIGVTRVMSAAIEQNHDDKGMIWPIPIAPFEVAVLSLVAKDPAVGELAERLYGELKAAGLDVLLDDRPLRPGVKFNDADLVGYPLQLIVGQKALDEGHVELKDRISGERFTKPPAEAVAWLVERVKEAKSYAW